MAPSLNSQAKRLYVQFAGLVRNYQFRDREEICCHGLSVSQCYTLDAVYDRSSMTMSELASHMMLDISTMTRIVDGLVAKKLISRVEDPRDRRVRRITVVAKGKALIGKIRGEMIKENERILREIPAGSREDVITAISLLKEVFEARREETCASKRKRRTVVGAAGKAS